MGQKHGFDKPMGGFLTPKSGADATALRGHFVAASGEFVGTFMFLLMAFLGHQMAHTQQVQSAHDGTAASSTVFYISLSYGFSLLVNAWILYRISGGLFNPAVTVGLIITGTLPVVRGLILIPVQIISGICAAAVASGIIPADIANVETTLAPGVSIAQGLFIEMFLTMLLVFTVLMLAAEKSKDTYLAPVGIGLSLFVAEMAGVYYTGASLNPARSFGPCVIAGNFQGYHWIYWIGPLLGALFSGGYYHFVKFFNYEEANPDQDSAGGQFEEVTMSRSRTDPEAYAEQDKPDSRNGYSSGRSQSHGHAQSNGQSRGQSRGQWPSRDQGQSQDRPSLNNRVESGTLHPGFVEDVQY